MYDAAYHHKYYLDHKETRDARSRRWRKEHPEQTTQIHRRRILKLKCEVLSHYGPEGRLQCAWPNCGITDIDMLTLDHLANDGARERREVRGVSKGGAGKIQYERVKRQQFPAGYQTLCCNHQSKKELMRRRGELPS